MQTPRILYDYGCPVCSNFIRLVKRKIPVESLEYYPSGPEAKDFEYINQQGTHSFGTVAIDAMSKDFPQITDYMWMLPPAYKTAGLKVAYKIGSAVRKVVGKVKKGCNCGRH